MSIVEDKLDELEAYQKKWRAELLNQLGLKPGQALTLSFDSQIELSAAANLEPVDLGFYVCKHDHSVIVEVVGQDIKSGSVLLDNSFGQTEGQSLEVISHRLFQLLFTPVEQSSITLGG